jgi:hypothetical protein
MIHFKIVIALVLLTTAMGCASDIGFRISQSTLGLGYSQTAVNTVIFRRNSLITFGDTQYVSYYGPDGAVMLGKRKVGESNWMIVKTRCKGDVTDAHRDISLAVDGAGFLHLSWDHHNNPLNYCKSVAPGSLELTDRLPMVGDTEDRVTYPEFYNGPHGSLIFLYRDGASGNGDLIVNQYDPATAKWSRLCRNLIAGEGQRNAYWQACSDADGTINLSWVWRESGDVSTNHDMCFARSGDGGKTWTRSDGTVYQLPITLAEAEVAWRIPQNAELINTTSICVDGKGHPHIATYFRPAPGGVPQYAMISHDGTAWHATQVMRRTLDFTLSGRGTKRVPISRPLVVARVVGERTQAFMVFRDEERGSKVSIARCNDLANPNWSVTDLTQDSVEMWEPTCDPVAWQTRGELDLFVQKVGQGDGEKTQAMPPQAVRVLSIKPMP